MYAEGGIAGGEISRSGDTAGKKTLESAFTTGDNSGWLQQSAAWLREIGGKGEAPAKIKEVKYKQNGKERERGK